MHMAKLFSWALFVETWKLLLFDHGSFLPLVSAQLCQRALERAMVQFTHLTRCTTALKWRFGVSRQCHGRCSFSLRFSHSRGLSGREVSPVESSAPPGVILRHFQAGCGISLLKQVLGLPRVQIQCDSSTMRRPERLYVKPHQPVCSGLLKNKINPV